ncbi:unnamed protein product [Closterium sp. NIES-54]
MSSSVMSRCLAVDGQQQLEQHINHHVMCRNALGLSFSMRFTWRLYWGTGDDPTAPLAEVARRELRDDMTGHHQLQPIFPGVSPYGSSAYGTPASTAGGAYLGANRYGSGMSSLYGGGGMYGAGGTAYGSAYSSPYASRLGGGYGGYGAGAGGYGAGGMYGSSYGMGGMGGYGSSLGGGMYGSGMTMGGMGGGMYGSGMGMGMGMGYGGEMGMGPHGGDPNAPPDGQGPPRAPTFWVSMLRVIHGVMTGFGRLCVLVDENTHAIHFFITALLQLCDRAGLLYGEVARFVLRLLGFRTPPSQRPKGLPPAPDAALLRGAPAAGAPAGSAPAAFSAPAKTAFSGAAVAVPAGGAAAGGPVGSWDNLWPGSS